MFDFGHRITDKRKKKMQLLFNYLLVEIRRKVVHHYKKGQSGQGLVNSLNLQMSLDREKRTCHD